MTRILMYNLSCIVLLLTGCQSVKVGPRALKSSHHAYHEALITTLDEQFLNSIVRLRYRDNLAFLETNVITQSNNAGGGLGFELSKTFMAAQHYTGAGKMNPSLNCSGNSQLVFNPLKGRDFVMKLMTPIQNPVLISMLQSGWRADRVFHLCVERVNNLYNAPTASGPTPAYAPEFEKFYRFTELLQLLQSNHLLAFGEQPDVNFPDMIVRILPHPTFKNEIAEFKQLANLDSNGNDFKLKSSFLEMSPKKLTMRARSLFGMFSLLSQGVEVPFEDEAKGLVTVTQNADGSRFDWSQLSMRFLTVHYSTDKLKPENTFAACRYRNKWFYISDDDLESKTSFMLLNQIFTLQSSKYAKTEPVLILSGS